MHTPHVQGSVLHSFSQVHCTCSQDTKCLSTQHKLYTRKCDWIIPNVILLFTIDITKTKIKLNLVSILYFILFYGMVRNNIDDWQCSDFYIRGLRSHFTSANMYEIWTNRLKS